MKVPFTVTHAWEYQALLDQALILEDNIRKTGNMKGKLSINKDHSEPSFKRRHTPEVNHSHKHGITIIKEVTSNILIAMVDPKEAMETGREMDMMTITITMDSIAKSRTQERSQPSALL
jgi:hypothetical protein